MNISRTLMTLVVLLTCSKLWAEPVRIVDTGAGPAAASGLLVSSAQWLAAGFTTDQPYSIESIEAWMQVSVGGVLSIQLYRGDAIPETLLFSNGIFSPPDVALGPDWKGVHGLNWTIEPGRYWAAFEVSSASTFRAAFPFPSAGGIQLAFRDLLLPGGGYVPLPSGDGRGSPWGVRVDAEPLNPIPEPMTFALVGGGLMLFTAYRRRHITIQR